MQMAFRVGYSLAVAILLVLVVILGVRTFYDEAERPARPTLMPPALGAELIVCELDGRCSKGGRWLTTEEEGELTDEEKRYLQVQRGYQEQLRDHEGNRVDFRRNVFIIASVLGIAAVVGSVALFRRVEAIPQGLLLGGLGVVIFGCVEAAGDFGEIGAAPLFAVIGAGLVAVLAAGYRFLGSPGRGGETISQ